jgi:hypothetical protein
MLSLYAISTLDAAPVTALEAGRGALRGVGWSPQGAFTWIGPEASSSPAVALWQRSSGQAQPVTLISGRSLGQGRLSPDGRAVALTSDESGRPEVFLYDVETKVFRLISRDGGQRPAWRADGRELFFVSGGQMMAAPVTPGPPVTVGTPIPLFRVPDPGGFPSDLGRSWDVSRDGSRFLFPVPTSPDLQTISIVTNWSPGGAK